MRSGPDQVFSSYISVIKLRRSLSFHFSLGNYLHLLVVGFRIKLLLSINKCGGFFQSMLDKRKVITFVILHGTNQTSLKSVGRLPMTSESTSHSLPYYL